jgi:peptidyl-prolyl cis-trans isomerase-like 1
MYYKHAPKTCRNFVELARRGYYDNVIFHRIIKVSPEFLLACVV